MSTKIMAGPVEFFGETELRQGIQDLAESLGVTFDEAARRACRAGLPVVRRERDMHELFVTYTRHDA